MTEQTEIIIAEPSNQIQLGSMSMATPADVVHRASVVASQLAEIVNKQNLYSNISGKKYVRVEGWNTLGAMLGVLPRELSVTESESGDFEATVELIRASDGVVVGRGSAIVGADENMWSKRPRYARRSMAITRATGKAFRLGFSWIMTLAGYEATPAEEMDAIADPPPEPPKKNGVTRPMNPETLKGMLQRKADKYQKGLKVATKVLQNLARALDQATTGKRKEFQVALGLEESTKESDPRLVQAVIDWLNPAWSEDAQAYIFDGMAATELALVIQEIASE